MYLHKPYIHLYKMGRYRIYNNNETNIFLWNMVSVMRWRVVMCIHNFVLNANQCWVTTCRAPFSVCLLACVAKYYHFATAHIAERTINFHLNDIFSFEHFYHIPWQYDWLHKKTFLQYHKTPSSHPKPLLVVDTQRRRWAIVSHIKTTTEYNRRKRRYCVTQKKSVPNPNLMKIILPFMMMSRRQPQGWIYGVISAKRS